jgi:molybdate/tungstate transport system substrate-binding protein
MLQLASQYYNVPNLSQSILANSPAKYVTSTETDNIAALQAGEIDYLAIYTSTAEEQGSGFEYLNLPPQINLSDSSMAAQYATASVQTSSGTQTGSPIIYAITIPTNAANPQAAEAFVNFLISSQGQAIMQKDGFVPINPAIADGITNMPTELQTAVAPWPTTTTP